MAVNCPLIPDTEQQRNETFMAAEDECIFTGQNNSSAALYNIRRRKKPETRKLHGSKRKVDYDR